jgi:hypothetical protein
MGKKSAAMVQAKVVKGGKAGAKKKLDCTAIKAIFGIVSGRYKDLDVADGQNREHGGAPAGAFYQSGRGHTGDVPMSGCGNYNPDNAWCWVVEDAQSHFTEHRFLTDRMAEFQATAAGGQKTLAQHLDAYQNAVEDCLHKGDRAPGLKDPERRELAKRAAECLRAEQEAAFKQADCNVPQSTKLRAQSLPLRTVRPPLPT